MQSTDDGSVGALPPRPPGDVRDDPRDPLRQEGWTRAVHARSTVRIFERRTRQLKRRLILLTFIGLAIPLVVGALAISYGTNRRLVDLVIQVVLPLLAVQLIVSLWSVVAGWVDAYSRGTQSVVLNSSLANRFEKLASSPPASEQALRDALALLVTEDDAQRSLDLREGVSDAEKRMGMRSALIRFQRKCASCTLVPPNMTPTDCGVCGDFPKRFAS
jgi:mobilome CxxCx(11)CxxC protein